jgi:hypothetical protein
VSSKGRRQPGNKNEFYATPARAILALLQSRLLELPGGTWVEPCAGTGAIIKTVNRCRDDVRWIIAEIDPLFDSFLSQLGLPADEDLVYHHRNQDILMPYQDWVSSPWHYGKVDVAIFNPPFSLTMKFIETAFERAQWVVCLQRTNFFGSQERAAWLRIHCPDIYSLPFRPSFRPDGSTDSIEYSWFVWPAGPRVRRTGTIAMLGEPETGQMPLAYQR